MSVRRLTELPVYPFGFGVYAVFFLWAQNVSKVRTADVIVPTLVVLVGTAVVYVISSILLRSFWRGAVVCAVLSFLFFSFGHIAGSSTNQAQEAAKAPANQALFLIVWAAVAVGSIVFVALRKPEARRLAFFTNVVVGVLLLMTVAQIGMAKVDERRQARALADAMPAAEPAGSPAGTTSPAAAKTPGAPDEAPKRDIFFILLDRYANQKTLEENYGYDNSYFIEGLRERGFYVASGSRSPYPKTPHSIQTTLNMEYVDLPEESSDWQLVYDKLKNPKSARFAKERGYKYVLMGSGYHSLRSDPAADINIVYDPKSGPVTTEFEQVLYNSTVLAAIAQRYNISTLDPRRADYERAAFQYQEIPNVARMPEPTFMFSHILITHPPYVYDRHCRFLPEDRLSAMTIPESYLETLECEGKKTLELIDELQDVPDDRKPIIVLQSDEGPGPVGWNPNTRAHYDWTTAPQDVMLEKFRILNAYYLPGISDPGLYENISPVNSFRKVFNLYFDAGFEMLPDRSYVFRNELEPYRFIDVTERVRD
jgi:hypothetical protein